MIAIANNGDESNHYEEDYDDVDDEDEDEEEDEMFREDFERKEKDLPSNNSATAMNLPYIGALPNNMQNTRMPQQL